MISSGKRLPAFTYLLPLWLPFFFLAFNSVIQDAPTMDEQNHLTRGLTFVATGDPHFSLEHPPLINTLSALPVMELLEVDIPLDHPNWQWARDGWYGVAESILWELNVGQVSTIIFLARLPIIFLTLGLSLMGYHFGKQLWHSQTAGILTATFLLFDPNILAHARYTTTDVGGMTFLLLAIFLLWRLWQKDGWCWQRWLLATIGLGLAFASKLSTLSFAPLLIILAILPLYPVHDGRVVLRRLTQLAVAGGASLVVVWACFNFEWQPFFFTSDLLAPLNQWSGPMPTYFAGIEQILFLSSGGRPSFLWGQFSASGFWTYFPVAFLVKTPLATLLLFAVAVVALLKQPTTRRSALFLLLPAIGYFLLSMQSALNIGYRHLFPILPLLYLLISGLVVVCRQSWQRWTLYGLTASLLLATLWIHPHYLSFFNVLAGGANHGRHILIDSNIDWGQDLIRLKQWLDEHPQTEPIYLSYFGTADPHAYGIDYRPLPGVPRHFNLWWDLPFDPQAPPAGLYAISVSNLGEPPLQTDEKVVFQWFREHEPIDQIGYSILIYQVTE